MNRPPLDWQDVAVQRERVMRDLSNLPWAPRPTSSFSVQFAKAVLFGLLPVCVAVWWGLL